MTFADTTTAPWACPPQIHLPRTKPASAPRKATRRPDLRAAEGIIMGALIGGNLMIWGFVIVRWLLA